MRALLVADFLTIIHDLHGLLLVLFNFDYGKGVPKPFVLSDGSGPNSLVFYQRPIGKQMTLPVHRVLPRVEQLGEALTDDHHAFATVFVGVVEVAPFLNRHPEPIEETRRYHLELGSKILSVRADARVSTREALTSLPRGILFCAAVCTFEALASLGAVVSGPCVRLRRG
ncbi:MAG TPA: hypothetical protein VK638_04115, partial [Edaphobacter sp.]|nr:hypothetical protein [Edaphobacter sp.]